MKLIIEIPEWKYKSICEGVEESKRCGVVGVDPDIHEAIYNGIPLDDVKAEIKGWYWQADKQALAKDPCVIDAMIDLFIRTIDNIGKESEEEV